MNENKSLQPGVLLKQKIALILFGLFLFFVLLEVSLRLGGFILLSIQEHRNLQSIQQKGAYRILCLGESTTAGQYPQFLEAILSQRNIGVRFSVIDKGVNGTNTQTILSQVESYLVEYYPDVVVAMMGINDRGEHIPFEVTTTSRGILFIRSFRTYKLARFIWLRILSKAKERGLYKLNQDRYLSNIIFKKDYAEPIATEESFKKAVELGPKNDNTFVELGWFYLDQGKFPQAEESFKKAVELGPKNDNAYVGLGVLYQDQGKFPRAEESFKKAVELNLRNDRAYVELGNFYREQREMSHAEESLKKALELNPKNDNAFAGLGHLYQGQGKFTQAEESLKKALELNPRNYYTYFLLGWLYQDQGSFTQAEDVFKKAIGPNPGKDVAYGALSILYNEISKPELANEYAQKANGLRLEYYKPVTADNYLKVKEILNKRGIRLVCVQYPMRSVESLKKIFQGQDEGVIFVDNESVFKEALKKASYKEYFRDMFAGDFGHCTEKGNRLLAQNIADTIIKEVFDKKSQGAF